MKTIIRIDDIGASSKQYNQYGKTYFSWKGIPYFYFPFAHCGFFKRMYPFKGWGPYEEITSGEWQEFFDLFERYQTIPLIGITAAWVESDGTLTPFPKKFPEEAACLKQALRDGKILLANHGLTHCVVGQHLPRSFQGNREQHREFWPWIEPRIHRDHILQSQTILENYFEIPITVFIPPGNVWSQHTYATLKETHITKVISNRYMLDSSEPLKGIEFVDDRQGFLVLHDKDLKERGPAWLELQLRKLQ